MGNENKLAMAESLFCAITLDRTSRAGSHARAVVIKFKLHIQAHPRGLILREGLLNVSKFGDYTHSSCLFIPKG